VSISKRNGYYDAPRGRSYNYETAYSIKQYMRNADGEFDTKATIILASMVIGIALLITWTIFAVVRNSRTRTAVENLENLRDSTKVAMGAVSVLLVDSNEADKLNTPYAESSPAVDKIRADFNSCSSTFWPSGYSTCWTIRERCAEQSVKLDGVRAYCVEKVELRNTVWDNERMLKARLMKPRNPSDKENTDDQTVVEGYFDQIAVASPELLVWIVGKPKELNNSLGDALRKSIPFRDWIAKKGDSDLERGKGNRMYTDAEQAFLEVMRLNDACVAEFPYYRPGVHDGKYSIDQYKKILTKQNIAVNKVREGDKLLSDMHQYYNELRSQWYTYVSEHRKKSKRFSHSSYYNGKHRTRHTDGYSYYYVLTTVRPNQPPTSEEKWVGERDGNDYMFGVIPDWSYLPEQQVGYVTEWKMYACDKQRIQRGPPSLVKPKLHVPAEAGGVE
jgi:hypothetical protein